MATHFNILAWRIPWTEEPGRLQSMGSQRLRHDWSDLAHTQSTGIWQRREMFTLFHYVTTSTLDFSNCIPFICPDSQTEEFNYTCLTVDVYINATVFTYIWHGFYCMEESPPNIPNFKRLKYISSNIVNYIQL